MENKKKRNRTKQTTDNKKVTKQKLTFPPLHQGCDIPSAEEKENKDIKQTNITAKTTRKRWTTQ